MRDLTVDRVYHAVLRQLQFGRRARRLASPRAARFCRVPSSARRGTMRAARGAAGRGASDAPYRQRPDRVYGRPVLRQLQFGHQHAA